MSQQAILCIGGFFTGLIDSIAGGGGLISLPLLSLYLGIGPLAVGTNKVNGLAAAFAALVVYLRKGHVQLQNAFVFILLTGCGAIAGARSASFVPPYIYKWALIVFCLLLLFVVLNRKLWIQRGIEIEAKKRLNSLVIPFLGFACGFYDGIAGPGGGTLMFLSLFLVAHLPLVAAIATSKIANSVSAMTSLFTFWRADQIDFTVVWPMAFCAVVGASIGARFASKLAQRIARIALAVIATLLLARLAWMP